MLDTGKVTLNLQLSYDYYNQYPRNYITIRLAIKWFTNLNIKRIPYDKTIMFTLDVNIIPTPNEEEILDRLVKKTIIVFNEIDDYIKLQK